MRKLTAIKLYSSMTISKTNLISILLMLPIEILMSIKLLLESIRQKILSSLKIILMNKSFWTKVKAVTIISTIKTRIILAIITIQTMVMM